MSASHPAIFETFLEDTKSQFLFTNWCGIGQNKKCLRKKDCYKIGTRQLQMYSKENFKK